jgi:ABC-type lipopolysaccharide export system ATPase subunit
MPAPTVIVLAGPNGAGKTTASQAAGVPIVVWRDGQVVEIPPEAIVVDPAKTMARRGELVIARR